MGARPIVKISQGLLRGCVMKDYDGENFCAFLGVPYGLPPLGELRFKAPQPAEPWDGIKDATNDDISFPQIDILAGPEVKGEENALHLNVFTKRLPSQENNLKPVMVWIHGGAWLRGSKKIGPEFLLTEEVVLVSVNYRLGVMGFLSLEDPSLEVPGNAALKDSLLALKWVQQNIRAFNGDPDNVTIFGESAGAGSVHHLVISPSAKGLFHKAIMQSGSAFNRWSMGPRISVMEYVGILGKDVKSEKEALEVLTTVSVKELFEAQEQYIQLQNIFLLQFTPVIERPNETAFITKHPIELVKNGKHNIVPMLLGYNSDEGMLFAMDKIKDDIAKREYIKPAMESFFPPNVMAKLNGADLETIRTKLRDAYFTEDNANNKYLYEGHGYFATGVIAAAKMHARVSKTPVYLYKMTLCDELNHATNKLKKWSKHGVSPGACHGDDLGYLFANVSFPLPKEGSSPELAMRRFVKLWTNFAKYGNPTPDVKELNITWKPIENECTNFLEIGSDLILRQDPEGSRMKIWKEIYDRDELTANIL